MKMFKVGFIAAYVLVVVFGVNSAFSSTYAADFAATLRARAGLVQYQPKGSTIWRNVRTSQQVRAGDRVRTAGNGVAQLTTATGIEIGIYPGSLVELKELSTSTTSGQTFILAQYVGTLFNNFTRPSGAKDLLQIVLPAAGLRVRGTQYWSVLTRSLEIGIFGQDNEVEVRSADGKTFAGNKDNIGRVILKAESPPAICTMDFLQQNTTSILVTSFDTPESIATIRSYLKATLTGQNSPAYRDFLTVILGLPKEKNDLDTLLKALDTYDPSKTGVSGLAKQYRDFLGDPNRTDLSSVIAPTTCGNGKKDNGETVDNCPSDFLVAARCGDGICEYRANDKSAEGPDNCPLDCLPKAGVPFVAACVDTIIGPRPTGTPTPIVIRRTSTPIPPVGTLTPTPSL